MIHSYTRNDMYDFADCINHDDYGCARVPTICPAHSSAHTSVNCSCQNIYNNFTSLHTFEIRFSMRSGAHRSENLQCKQCHKLVKQQQPPPPPHHHITVAEIIFSRCTLFGMFLDMDAYLVRPMLQYACIK